jgi:vacuolar-type H+-ATPase subunit I/STV1
MSNTCQDLQEENQQLHKIIELLFSLNSSEFNKLKYNKMNSNPEHLLDELNAIILYKKEQEELWIENTIQDYENNFQDYENNFQEQSDFEQKANQIWLEYNDPTIVWPSPKMYDEDEEM